ncbi:MAG: glycerate kinase [Candidatus Cloacimonetes bacterium]|nr:glycerate kinase [Candidatus Cloacimonadota bacterium]
MKIIVASDSFKGTLTSLEACEAIRDGILRAKPDADVRIYPMSDGGDGSLDVLQYYLSGETIDALATDPLGRRIATKWLKVGKRAYIEIASASGLNLIKNELNPLYANTYGTGEMILEAVNSGCDEIYLLLGGSGTTDCGCGILNALGIDFMDSEDMTIRPSGGTLERFVRIDTSGIPENVRNSHFYLATDVSNLLLGKNGTARIYAPQKGASCKDVDLLERNLVVFVDLLIEITGKEIHTFEGSGAAGGIPVGILSFFEGAIISGYKLFKDVSGFLDELSDADLVITGEGKIDYQTFCGKLPYSIAQETKEAGVKCIAFCGVKGDNWERFADTGVSVFSILNDSSEPLPEEPHRELIKLAETSIMDFI